jgi:hypothetical protein
MSKFLVGELLDRIPQLGRGRGCARDLNVPGAGPVHE